jgi:glycosyltransferase involved in cell wall biosynthesis
MPAELRMTERAKQGTPNIGRFGSPERKAPRLCILTQYWPPEMGAPQGRLSELGERLIDLGWEVEALTALPNYPAGRIFDGYDPLRPKVEHVGRIRTVRVPMWPSKTGFAKRVGSYFSFAGAAIAYGPRLATRPDVLFVESPPLFILYAAWSLSRRWRCPYVMNVSDLWPESAVRMGIVSARHPATRLAERLERRGYARAAGVTGQSTGIVEGVRARSPGTPACVVTNGVDPSRFGKAKADAGARAILGGEPGPVFVYAGLFGYAQGLFQILDASKRLEGPGRFVLIGDGPVRAELEARIANEGLHRVKLAPPVPRDRIPPLLAAADAAIITLGMDIPGAVPSKIYEAMAAELPILIVAEGEPVDRVVRPECGMSVRPGDIDGLTSAIRTLAAQPALRAEFGRRGRLAAESTYDRTRIAETLSAFLEEAARRPSSAG